MQKNSKSKSIEELLADADELIRQINLDAVKGLKEEHRLQFEKHAQYFKKIKSEVQGKIRNFGNRHRLRGHARGNSGYCEGHA